MAATDLQVQQNCLRFMNDFSDWLHLHQQQPEIRHSTLNTSIISFPKTAHVCRDQHTTLMAAAALPIWNMKLSFPSVPVDKHNIYNCLSLKACCACEV